MSFSSSSRARDCDGRLLLNQLSMPATGEEFAGRRAETGGTSVERRKRWKLNPIQRSINIKCRYLLIATGSVDH